MNKIPTLDKGYVGLVSRSLSKGDLKKIQTQFFRNKVTSGLLQTPTLHLEIKCPLFVQLALAERLRCTAKTAALEAFIPSVADVSAKDVQTSEIISKDIEQTTEALLLNPKAYQMDGCDIFISQVISPINVYNTLLVSGTLSQWADFVNLKGLPLPIEEYRKSIEQVILGEYDHLWEYIGEKKNKEAGS